MTWQTGFTGIAYNTKFIKRPITSFNDLADPAFKGHVGMMNDNVELGCDGAVRMGVKPENSTPQTVGRVNEVAGRSNANWYSGTTTRVTSSTSKTKTPGSLKPGQATSSRRTSRATRT